MQPDLYKFFINGTTEVFPHYKSLQKKYSIESNQRFFRTTLEGDIKLYGADYYFIERSPISMDFTLAIHKKVNNTWELFYEGFFSKTDCQFDLDKHEVKIKVSAKDEYSTILAKYSNTYNLTDLIPEYTPVNIAKRPILQVYVYEDNVITNFSPSGESWVQEVDLGGMTIENLKSQAFLRMDALLQPSMAEITIASGPYKGTYVGKSVDDSFNTVFLSSDNLNYEIKGTVQEKDNGVAYNLKLYEKGKDTYIYRTGDATATSRFFTATFSTPSAFDTSSFKADVIFDLVFGRIVSGMSVSYNGAVATYTLDASSFGWIKGYKYAFKLTTPFYYVALQDASSEEPTIHGKAPNGLYYTQPTNANQHYYAFAKNTWNMASKWIRFYNTFTEPSTDRPMSVDVEYSVYSDVPCMPLSDIIASLLKKIDPTISHAGTEEYSSFFYGSNNPVYGDKLNIFMTQKSNVLTFIYSEAAKKVPITFESLMNMLKKCFNCYWFIEDKKLKIEHAVYFQNGKTYNKETQKIGLDLTKIYNIRNGKAVGSGQNKIAFNKNNLPARYEFSYADDVSLAFEGPALQIQASYVQQDKIESVTIEDFNADIDAMLANSENINKDGFAIIAASFNETEDGGFYSSDKYALKLQDEKGLEYTELLQNGMLSWLNLVNFYFTSMPSTSAEYDGYPKVPIKITGVTPFMTQEIIVPVEKDPDLYALVATNIGKGQIEDLSIDLTTKQAKLSLLYGVE